MILARLGIYFDEKYFDDLATYYPNLTWDTVGAIVFFRILHVNDVPVVSINEFGNEFSRD